MFRSFFAVRIWRCQWAMSDSPYTMLTLSLVSEKNLLLTGTLVSASAPPPLSHIVDRSEGRIYCGRIWYVSLASTRETVTQLPPSNHSCHHRYVVSPRDERYLQFSPITVYAALGWVFGIGTCLYYKLTQCRRIPIHKFAELGRLTVRFSSEVSIS